MKNRLLKQTHHQESAETFKPLFKKTAEVKESSEKLKEVLGRTDSEVVKPTLPHTYKVRKVKQQHLYQLAMNQLKHLVKRMTVKFI